MDEIKPVSRLEVILGDLKPFKIMLDGAFKDWEGTYDVLLVDTNEYLYNSPDNPDFRPFCRRLRSKPEGNARCKRCDEQFADRVARDPENTRKQIYYCHVGLWDIAIPILVEGEHIATVFCGQVRPTDETQDAKHFDLVRDIERELDFIAGELIELAKETPQKSLEHLSEVRKRVAQLVDYISNLGHERLQLQEALKKSELEKKMQEKRDELTEKAHQVLNDGTRRLIEAKTDYTIFWEQAGRVLEAMGAVIHAKCAMILLPINKATELEVKAVAGLPFEQFNAQTYQFYDPVLKEVLTGEKISRIATFDNFEEPQTISGSIRQYDATLSASLDTVILIHIRLDHVPGESNGLLLFCTDKKSSMIPLSEITQPLTQLGGLIGVAFHNANLYQEKEQELLKRRNWLQQVSHQLLSPLHGLTGYADNVRTRQKRWEAETPEYFSSWDKEKLEKWKNTLDSIIWTSSYAARLARNLEWFALPEDQKKAKLDMKRVDDIGELMIRYARDFQGIARRRKLRSVRVITDSFPEYVHPICVDDDLLRQAVGNLLDNAVKYSRRGTNVIIDGDTDSHIMTIRVINEGIRLLEPEVEKIFEYSYRGQEAMNRYAPGTGIGLPVAREIITLHNGRLIASPSVSTGSSWKTTFTITLPILEDCHPQGGMSD